MKLHSIDTGLFKLDGGAMFGVVPKSMWQKLNPPDDNNMCTWAMRCLLIEENDKLILIDTGMGTKQDDKFRSHFYPHGDATLVSSIEKAGYSVNDVTDVILTHLHFDHSGGAIARLQNGELTPQFPKAKIWSDRKQWNWAMTPNDREKASFLKENLQPIEDFGQLYFLEENSFENYKINFEVANGHTEAMTIPIIDYNGQKIIFAADLMPSSYHIPMAYVMGYDIRPLDSLQERQKLYKYALEHNACILFEHDPVNELGFVKKNEQGRVVLDQIGKISDL